MALSPSLQAWLLEINSSPSLAIENPLDDAIKSAMVADTIRIVEPPAVDREALFRALQRRTSEAEKPWCASKASTPEVLDRDMHELLMGAAPRRVGELPPDLGNFQCIAPSLMYDSIAKYRRQPRAKPKLTGDGLTSVSVAADGRPDKRK